MILYIICNHYKMNSALHITRMLNISCKRHMSSIKLPSEIVVPLSKDMIICWHPEPKFPYECSLPLPEEKQVPSNSILAIGEKEISEVFKKKRSEVVIEELSKMTYTTKHRWYPKKDRNPIKIKPERPYL
ncbi:mitochondrial ribosomal protein L42 isoform X2 [Megachile rotundata]|uniref:mitochondrial ribosomal protein L42 isoform X2 n=1 Tax=Megachile rotundata TaxID=143995 RepID=UPI003FD1F04B